MNREKSCSSSRKTRTWCRNGNFHVATEWYVARRERPAAGAAHGGAAGFSTDGQSGTGDGHTRVCAGGDSVHPGVSVEGRRHRHRVGAGWTDADTAWHVSVIGSGVPAREAQKSKAPPRQRKPEWATRFKVLVNWSAGRASRGGRVVTPPFSNRGKRMGNPQSTIL